MTTNNTSTPTAEQPSNTTLAAELEALHSRLDRLEAAIERKDDKIDRLERANDRLETTVSSLSDRLTEVDSDSTRLSRCVDAVRKKTNMNKHRLTELQSRELEKGAHLRTEMVDKQAVDVPGGQLERITKEEETYYRLPEHADPLADSGSVTLAYGDLLPIQQLARMDDDMLRSTANALPTRLAAQLWAARTDSTVGDNPWEQGCKGVKEYIKASDLKHWIRRQESGVSESYAKKLVSRTIDAFIDLSKNRVGIRKKSERKNGLPYTERRLIIPEDADFPGMVKDRTKTTPEPETTGVHS